MISDRAKTLLAATLATFATTIIGSCITVALPDISNELEMSAVLITWVNNAYILASSVFVLPVGRLGDIVGRKKIFLFGIVILVASSIICTTSHSGAMLVGGRAIGGIGNAMIMAPGTAIIVSAFPPSERGKAVGLYSIAAYLGLSLGPIIGGVLTENLGWRSIFLVNITFMLAALAFLYQVRKTADSRVRARFDFAGGLFWGIGIVPLVLGISAFPNLYAIWLVLAGAAVLFIFTRWETRNREPLININLFRRNRLFVFSNIAALINYSATWSVAFMLSLYLQYIQRLSPEMAGLILVIIPGIETIFAPLAGRLSDRIGTRGLTSSGMAINTAGLLMLGFLGQNTSITLIVFSLIAIGFGLAIFVPPNSSAIMSSVEPVNYGIASASVSVARQIGMMLSMAIAAVLFSIFIGQAVITPEYYPGFITSVRVAMFTCAGLSFAGVFVSLARPTGNPANTLRQ